MIRPEVHEPEIHEPSQSTAIEHVQRKKQRVGGFCRVFVTVNCAMIKFFSSNLYILQTVYVNLL